MEFAAPHRRSVHRVATGVLVGLLACAMWVWSVPRAAAAPNLDIHWRVDAQTHLAKLNRDVVVPRGTFDGALDLATGDLTGSLALPPATLRLDAVPGLLPLADASFSIEQAEPITG